MSDTIEIKFAKGITSLTAVMVPMLLNITGLAIAGGHLLYHNFPKENMSDATKLPAAIVIGITIAMTLMSVAVNKKILQPWSDKHEWIGFPLLLAVFSGILLLFFFDVFGKWNERAWHVSFLKIFLSGFLAFLEYIFAYLFVQKFAEVLATVKFETKIAKLLTTNRKLETTISQLTHTVEQLKPTKSQLNSVTKNLEKLKEELTCKKCGKMKKARSLASHESTCKGVLVNGVEG